MTAVNAPRRPGRHHSAKPGARTVIDASAMADVFLEGPRGDSAGQAVAAARQLWAPALFDSEVNAISQRAADEAVHAVRAAPIRRAP